MRIILVANPKGGSGKTTLATNLAGYFASQGQHVALSDMDRQQSSISWLERRPGELPFIHGAGGKAKHIDELDTDWTIIDSPAGLHGEKLSDMVKRADLVIVPMQASAFDIGATQDFLDTLSEEKAVRKERTFVAMVGIRIDHRTRSAARLRDYLDESGFPVIGNLRNTQLYVSAAENGMSLFDLRPSLAARDIEEWTSIIDWLRAS